MFDALLDESSFYHAEFPLHLSPDLDESFLSYFLLNYHTFSLILGFESSSHSQQQLKEQIVLLSIPFDGSLDDFEANQGSSTQSFTSKTKDNLQKWIDLFYLACTGKAISLNSEEIDYFIEVFALIVNQYPVPSLKTIDCISLLYRLKIQYIKDDQILSLFAGYLQIFENKKMSSNVLLSKMMSNVEWILQIILKSKAQSKLEQFPDFICDFCDHVLSLLISVDSSSEHYSRIFQCVFSLISISPHDHVYVFREILSRKLTLFTLEIQFWCVSLLSLVLYRLQSLDKDTQSELQKCLVKAKSKDILNKIIKVCMTEKRLFPQLLLPLIQIEVQEMYLKTTTSENQTLPSNKIWVSLMLSSIVTAFHRKKDPLTKEQIEFFLVCVQKEVKDKRKFLESFERFAPVSLLVPFKASLENEFVSVLVELVSEEKVKMKLKRNQNQKQQSSQVSASGGTGRPRMKKLRMKRLGRK